MAELYLRLANWFKSEQGQDLIEYALLVVFIAVLVLVILPLVGQQVSQVFSRINSYLASGMGS